MVLLNKKARFDYDIQETLTAGMSLLGWEVKSITHGSASLKGAWISIRAGEAWLQNFDVTPWKFSQEVQNSHREKKLLLKKREILKLETKMRDKNYTIVPLKVFTQNGFLKCEIGLAQGRKKYEKKQVLKERAEKKTAQKAMKHFL
ncbi:SsrA-binding protein [bacterium DOLZORAL124_38_8]|nr:MAG: SsrA-binding protein [bacterium DOLZORAL124_38_8]